MKKDELRIEIRIAMNGYTAVVDSDMGRGHIGDIYVAKDLDHLCQVVREIVQKPKKKCECEDQSK